MKQPKRALSSNISNRLYEALARLHRKVVAHSELSLTHKDYLDLFVAPELHDVSETAATLFQTEGYYNSFVGSIAGIDMEFELRGKNHPLLPRGVGALQGAADPGLVATIVAWANQRIESGYEFGRVQRVFDILDHKCATPEQVRFFFPGILTLCASEAEDTTLSAFADRVRVYRAPDKIPVLGPAFLSACHAASGTIAMSQLLSDPVDAGRPPFEVTLAKMPTRRDPVLGDIPCLL